MEVTPIEERMLALEKIVRKSLEEPARKAAPVTVPGPGGQPTYASIVAPPATKAAVRIRVEGSDKMQPAELLRKAKSKIVGAYAVRQLRSNDTEVFVQSVSQRDAALKMVQPKDFQILKQDHHVEIVGVPLGTIIQRGRTGDNRRIIYEIEEATKTQIPGIKITRLRWLHDGKEHQWSGTNGHTRGSVIMRLPTEALQREVVRKGIVINSILYTAQLWSPRAQAKQCFNCSQWGHTQASCNRTTRCGECAGAHQTRDCPKKSVACCNCGKSHKAWQNGACPSFTQYKASIQRARYELLERTAEIRRTAETIKPTAIMKTAAQATADQGFTGVTNKPEGVKRGPGRPRKEKIPTTTNSTFTQPNDVRPQASSISTSSTPKVTAIPMKDGELYFT
ncbi:hypothetical protein K3495_g991 [Podosphaera aphanis]|nr:hypothetical protein K3495_g991 [Podosphaera aphanis]